MSIERTEISVVEVYSAKPTAIWIARFISRSKSSPSSINSTTWHVVLQIQDHNAPKFKPVTLGSADALSVGDGLWRHWSRSGLERTVTQGILSTKTRELEGELYLQTSTQINPGNGGGPLQNLAGRGDGVTNMKINFGVRQFWDLRFRLNW